MKRREENIDPEEEQEMTLEPEEEDIPVEEEQGEAKEQAHPSLKEVIKEKAREDEQPFSSTFSLRTILGGDILNTQAIREQI